MSDNAAMHREGFDVLCGRRLGTGMSRDVFECRILPECVVKVEETSQHFQNVVEWEAWKIVKDTPYSRWFAACRWISPNGAVLIMEKTVPAGPADYPDKMPAFLCDFKKNNYGLSYAQDPKTGKMFYTFVAHDYGTNLLVENGLSKRMKSVEWLDRG